MKLYLINNICVSTSPINGTQEVELQTTNRDNPSNYINKRIIIFDSGYKVEIPSQLEIANAYAPILLQQNTQLKEEVKLSTDGLKTLESYILEQELNNIEGA